MFDDITLRVADLAADTRAFAAVPDELEIEQTTSTPSFSVWGNFALTQTNAEHPIARRAHIAFIAPTPAHVDRFVAAGIDAGFADHAGFLTDGAGNGFEAVHRDGERPRGNIDHVAVRVKDVEASTAFYSTIGAAAGLTIRSVADDPTVAERTWVLSAESLEGGWGVGGHVNSDCEISLSRNDLNMTGARARTGRDFNERQLL